MTKTNGLQLFRRRPLDEITEVPDGIISVYVVENHIWADGGSEKARAERRPEPRTVDEFLINPVRSFLNDILRLMAAPWDPERRDDPVGQGYWIQAEFGSGKSHLLSLLGNLALGKAETWDMIRDKEQAQGLGRRESIYRFYEDGLKRKSEESRGILVVVKTLVGQGGSSVSGQDSSRGLVDYVMDAVAEQFKLETGRSLPLYPTELLVERFLNSGDLERYQRDLARFLKDPAYFDEEQQEELSDFVRDLQETADVGRRRDCGDKLWSFYELYLKVRPQIAVDTEPLLENMVRRVIDAGYAGVLIILDEVSLYTLTRNEVQRAEDEKTLVVLSNRLARFRNLPVWTVCSAQQAIESRLAGVGNLIARERLDLVLLLSNAESYYDIALSRVRRITDPGAIDQYFEDYKRSFSWPQATGREAFARFFPYYPPSIDVVRTVSMNLTTVRSALYFMLETLRHQRKEHSRELISLWALFEEVVEYQEDPSGTTRAIASIRTKWPELWRAYEVGKAQIDAATGGYMKVYGTRCDRILRTLFLYHVAGTRPEGLSVEEIMNTVMEWRDHAQGQTADLQDNLDHYQILLDELSQMQQVEKTGTRYRFNPAQTGISPPEVFRRIRSELANNERERRDAWHDLLGLDTWIVRSGALTVDLAQGLRSIFRDIAPESQTNVSVIWNGRRVEGRVLMRDLVHEASRGGILPQVNSAETGQDFYVFVSSTAAAAVADDLVRVTKDPRVLFWTPDALSPAEEGLLLDYAAYRVMVREYSRQDSQDAQTVLNWIQERLRDNLGTIYRIVPDSYGRGRIAALEHSHLSFTCSGELSAILTPLVEQVLDAVYVCEELEFTGPAAFTDADAVYVIDGLVKLGEYERGARPDRSLSAAQNFAFALGIARPPNDRKLDLSSCRYTADMLAWIEKRLPSPTEQMPVTTLYKNFMGLNGANGKNYGLSKRMVQLYLLSLVREGKLRVGLSGRNVPAEAIDYSNIATIDFRAATLDAMSIVQRIKPPENWALLAPYAGAILGDDDLTRLEEDAAIQQAVQRLLDYREEQHTRLASFAEDFRLLCVDLGQPDPTEDRLAQWVAFLGAAVRSDDPTLHMLHALDQAFGYSVYAEERADPGEVDDLKTRLVEVKHALTFYELRDRLRAAASYAAYAYPDLPELASVDSALHRTQTQLTNLAHYVDSEAALRTELLAPAEDAMAEYRTRYLQAWDRVCETVENTRRALTDLAESRAYVALVRLAALPQLGPDAIPALRHDLTELATALLDTSVSRSALARALARGPEPSDTPMTLHNASKWVEAAQEAQRGGETALDRQVLNKAKLFCGDALRARLRQGEDEPLIARLLQAGSPDALAAVLVDVMGGGQAEADRAIETIGRYLRKIVIRQVRVAGFRPTERTLEKESIPTVVGQFQAYLEEQFAGNDDDLVVLELT